MSTQNETTAIAVRHADVAARVDAIARRSPALLLSGSFAETLELATTIGELKSLLTPEVMAPIMALMNSPLGFMTDRDPSKIDPKTGKPFIPYSVEVVTVVLIEATFRGYRPVGNEFNIIAERFYAAQAGIRRKIMTYAGVTDVRESYEVPRIVADKGAIVKARVTWKNAGIPDYIEAELPVRINASMGSDAVLGKAQRKLLKRMLDKLTGIITPEGEVNDGDAIEVETVKQAPQARFDAPPIPAPTPAPQSAPEVKIVPKEAAPEKSIQDKLGDFLVDAGVAFDDFRGWLQTTGRIEDADSIDSFNSVPTKVCEALQKDPKALLKCVALYGKKPAAKV